VQSGIQGKVTFVSYAKPFKWLAKVTLPDGEQRTSGFDGKVSWSTDHKGAEVDDSTPLESVRRDADLQYPPAPNRLFREIRIGRDHGF